MNLEDQYKCLIGAYYGVIEMDEYNLKEYVLKDIENYIRDFISVYQLKDFDYRQKASEIENDMLLKTKLQDALIVLNKINGPMDLTLMIQQRIKEFDEK